MRSGAAVEVVPLEENAARLRALIESGRSTPTLVRTTLLSVPPPDRDAWFDRVLGLGGVPEDGPDLPRGCTPYLPCSVDALLGVVEQVPMDASDVFVDVGSGLGRAALLVHFLTGARAIGVEVQSGLVTAARELAKRLGVSRVSTVHGDAAKLGGLVQNGTVFFLYCPFSGPRLAKVLADLELVARERVIRVCCVGLPPLPCRWLTVTPQERCDLTIYSSSLAA